jgi:hypothetical protein
MMVALSLLAAVTAQISPTVAVRRPEVAVVTMQASVTIIKAEIIDSQPLNLREKPTDRQYRTREDLPLVEFY